MSSKVMPEGEGLRRAMRWVSERVQEEPERTRVSLVDEASRRFNLSPQQAEYLIAAMREADRSAKSG
ncbi:MAG: hypothetical protein QNK04_32960 [Myxococcota bacterium]|nr:hypothetical protein [Myxococcota bacterium]